MLRSPRPVFEIHSIAADPLRRRSRSFWEEVEFRCIAASFYALIGSSAAKVNGIRILSIITWVKVIKVVNSH